MKNNHANKDLREFADLVKKIFGDNLKKMALFGEGELFLLFSKLDKDDRAEIARISEEWSKSHYPVTPLAIDERGYLALKSTGNQLARDIEKTGVVL